MAQLIRIRQDLIVSTDEITVAGLAFVELRDGRSFSIVPAVWAALQEVALPERGVDVTPFEERDVPPAPSVKDMMTPGPSYAAVLAKQQAEHMLPTFVVKGGTVIRPKSEPK